MWVHVPGRHQDKREQGEVSVVVAMSGWGCHTKSQSNHKSEFSSSVTKRPKKKQTKKNKIKKTTRLLFFIKNCLKIEMLSFQKNIETPDAVCLCMNSGKKKKRKKK